MEWESNNLYIMAQDFFVFKACPVLDTGARQQALSTGKCKCRLRQETGCGHNELCNCCCKASVFCLRPKHMDVFQRQVRMHKLYCPIPMQSVVRNQFGHRYPYCSQPGIYLIHIFDGNQRPNLHLV